MKVKTLKFALFCVFLMVLLTVSICPTCLNIKNQSKSSNNELSVYGEDNERCINDPLEAWSEASYIIWKRDSTHYAARNMSTLLVDYVDSNASYVIQSAIDALTSDGGLIFIKAARYSGVAVTIKQSNVCIEGENPHSTYLIGLDGQTVIKFDSGLTMHHASVSNLHICGGDIGVNFETVSRNGLLSNLFIEYQTSYGIFIHEGGSSKIENCWISHAEQGIRITGNSRHNIIDSTSVTGCTTGIYLHNAEWTGILNSWIVTNSNYGVEIDVHSYNVRIIDCVIGGNKHYGVLIGSNGHADHCLLMGNDISGNGDELAGGAGIKVNKSHGSWMMNNYHEDNHIYNILIEGESGDKSLNNLIIGSRFNTFLDGLYGIYLNHAENTKIYGDDFYLAATATADIHITANATRTYIQDPQPSFSGLTVIDLGTNTRYEQYFVTQNSGTATGTSPIVIAHGLAGTPDIVTLGANAAQPYSLSWTANSTHIAIYHSSAGSLTVTWYCEYKP